MSKEQMQKQSLYVSFGRDHHAMDLVDEGFSLGAEDWRSHLSSMYSAREVQDFFKTYSEAIQRPEATEHLTPPHAIAAKEQMQKQRLYILFGGSKAVKDVIDAAFEAGTKEWEEHLNSMYPTREVDAVFKIYPREAHPVHQPR